MPKTKSEAAKPAAAQTGNLLGQGATAIAGQEPHQAEQVAGMSLRPPGPTIGEVAQTEAVGRVPLRDMPSDPPFDTSAPLFDQDDKPLPAPPTAAGPRPGVFMATPGEVRQIITRARGRKFDLVELLATLPDPTGVRLVDDNGGQTIEGLSKEGFRHLRAQLGD